MKRLFLALLIFAGCYGDDYYSEVVAMAEAKTIKIKFVVDGVTDEFEIRQLDSNNVRHEFPYINDLPWVFVDEVTIEPDADGVFPVIPVYMMAWNRWNFGNLSGYIYFDKGNGWELLTEVHSSGAFCYATVWGDIDVN